MFFQHHCASVKHTYGCKHLGMLSFQFIAKTVTNFTQNKHVFMPQTEKKSRSFDSLSPVMNCHQFQKLVGLVYNEQEGKELKGKLKQWTLCLSLRTTPHAPVVAFAFRKCAQIPAHARPGETTEHSDIPTNQSLFVSLVILWLPLIS